MYNPAPVGRPTAYREAPWSVPAVDYRVVLARRSHYMPLTPQGVAALVELERHAKVQNWIAEGRIHRAMYATRVIMYRLKPDGTLTEMYAV